MSEIEHANGIEAGQYRKKPVVIQAVQLSHTNAGDVAAWVNGHYVDEDVAAIRGGPSGGSFGAVVLIRTLEGTMQAEPDDWVIRGVQHEFYPCKPDIFDATYEPVEVP